MIINIRGTNGSGKTTLVRQLLGADPLPVDLVSYPAPTKKDPKRFRWVEGYGSRDHDFLAVGSYRQGCGGMDTIPSFDLQQQAVAQAASFTPVRIKNVLCEGVLASTVAGSWLTFFEAMQKRDYPVLVAYLDTPVELCLERITARQIAAKGTAREIKVDQVRDKVRAITATRDKFDAAGIRTVTLRHDSAQADLLSALSPASRFGGII